MSDAAVDASFHLSFFVAEVHASSLAVSEYLAMGTYSGFHPFVVAELSETGVPDVHELVFVDVALKVIGGYCGAASYFSIDVYASYGYACLA